MLCYNIVTMARLETQINPIYLTYPENKNSSLVLYEEALSSTGHLFIVAELKNLKRKSEALDLKKISEIILESFRIHKKLPGEALFESSLSQINQNLADLAHAGHKSWVGKFSCLIAFRSGEKIYLANNGQTSAWLKRQSELSEILSAEKRGNHPLKTFVNFTQGKIQNADAVILTTSNIFNFVSLQVFTKILSSESGQNATAQLSQILKDSMSSQESFATFLLNFDKKTEVIGSETEPTRAIYAPLPEEIEMATPRSWKFPTIKLPKVSLPTIRLRQWQFFQNLSRAGKFFFISFSIFLLLFLGNLGVYATKHQAQKTQDKINQQAGTLTQDISDAQSALIYKNNTEALRLLGQAETDFLALEKLNHARAAEFTNQLQSLKDQVNKISVITDPKIFLELKRHPTYLAQTAIGLLFANQDSNSLSLESKGVLTDYFLLNSLKDPITGITNYPPAGVVVSAGNGIYHIDSSLKQFEPVVNIDKAALFGLKTYGNTLYGLNTAANQVLKVSYTKGKFATLNINTPSLQDLRDFAVDKDIYLLYPDKLTKVTGGQPQVFNYPTLTDPISNASKIFVATNLYILEANKKRVVILNKNGQLLNQIYLPSASSLFDLAVDEAGRNIYLLDNNKLYKITF